MEPLLQFDSANLCVWYIRLPVAEDEFDVIDHVAEPALLGDHGTALERVNEIADGPERVRGANVLSSVWHEQRHFVDVMLTNFGQSIVRQAMTMLVNVPPLMRAARPHGRVALPLKVYRDSVRRRIAGVEPVNDLAEAGRLARDREQMLYHDARQHQLPDGGTVSIGGLAQLEALGSFTQLVAAQHELGPDLSAAIQADVPDRRSVYLRYQWAQFLQDALGLVAPGGADTGAVLVPPINAFLYGTLMIRRWKQDQTFVEGGDSGSAAARFDPLYTELKQSGTLLDARSAREAWSAVDDACKRVFGRSALEELRHDLSHEADFLGRVADTAGGHEDLRYRFLAGVHDARVRLAELFEETPELVIDPTRYSELLTKVDPIPLFVDLAGGDPDLPKGWEALWTGSGELGAFGRLDWCWASAPTGLIRSGDRIHVAPDEEAWTSAVRDLLPVAKLMLQGRRQSAILPAELDHGEASLRAFGTEPRFDPLYATPTLNTSSEAFWFLTGRSSAVCDGCGVDMTRGAGHYVGAAAFRRNDALATWLVEHYGGGELGLFSARRNQTGWLLCDACHRELSNLGAPFAETAKTA